MSGFEYKVVPAPMRGLKAKGVKGTPARFANALETVMNDLGAEGWEYQRTDTLPVEERQGLTGKTTSFQNMLVFRRALEDVAQEAPEIAALIEDQTPVLAAVPLKDAVTDPMADPVAQTDPEAAPVAEDAAETEEHTDDVVQLNADDRVSETLKAPFSMPWNNRSATKAADTDGDAKDANVPAE